MFGVEHEEKTSRFLFMLCASAWKQLVTGIQMKGKKIYLKVKIHDSFLEHDCIIWLINNIKSPHLPFHFLLQHRSSSDFIIMKKNETFQS